MDTIAADSAIGFSELCRLTARILPSPTGDIDPLPSLLASCLQYIYRTGSHSTAARHVVGAVLLIATPPYTRLMRMQHISFDGSSQWVLQSNLTLLHSIAGPVDMASQANTHPIDGGFIELPEPTIDHIKLPFLELDYISTFPSTYSRLRSEFI